MNGETTETFPFDPGLASARFRTLKISPRPGMPGTWEVEARKRPPASFIEAFARRERVAR